MCMILELWFIQFLNNCTVNIICCCCMLIKSCFELKVSNIVFILRMSKYLVYNCSRNLHGQRWDLIQSIKWNLILLSMIFLSSWTGKNMTNILRCRILPILLSGKTNQKQHINKTCQSLSKVFGGSVILRNFLIEVSLVHVLIIGLCCYRSWCTAIVFVFFPSISLILI